MPKFLLCIALSLVCIHHTYAASPDLTFNLLHKKSKADVYKTIIAYFKNNEARNNYRLGSIKNFKQGSIDVFSFYQCETSDRSYKLNIVVSEKNVMLRFMLSEEKNDDTKCINRTYDRCIALKDRLAEAIDSLKDAATYRVPPDVSAGLGFKNISFGISSDSVASLLAINGYLEGDHEVSLHPKFYENYFERDTVAGKKSFMVIIKFGKYVSRVKLGFTPDDLFYSFQIELPARTAEFFLHVRDRDCLFLTDLFQVKYGEPDTIRQLEKDDVTLPDGTQTALWHKEHYSAYVAITFHNAKYTAVGVVKSTPLEDAMHKLQHQEKMNKLKNASERF